VLIYISPLIAGTNRKTYLLHASFALKDSRCRCRPVILWIYPPQIAIVMKLGIFASFDPCNNIVKVKENRGIGTLPNFGIPVFFENTR